jgi:cytochrome c553
MKIKIATGVVMGSAMLLAAGMSQAADVNAGKAKFSSICASCHGPTAQGMGIFPKLAGQTADALAGKLKQYRAGETVGANTALMAPNAKGLSDADIANVSSYIATLK